VWPDHLQDPGLAPPGWELLTPADAGYPSFIEGGCYVVDRGEAVYNLQVLDDPAQPNPGQTGTLGGNTGNYNLDFYYIIRFGNAPYTVDIDFDWGGTFNDGTAGRVTLGAEVEAASGANSAIDEAVPAAIPDGTYQMAIRVTDSTAVVDGGPQTATFVWPTLVTLTPQFIFRDTFNTYANTAAWLGAGWQRANPANFTSTSLEFLSTTNVASARWYWGTQFGGAFNSYNGGMLHSDAGADNSNGSSNYGTNACATMRTPSFTAPAGTKRLLFRMQLTTAGDTSFWDRCWVGLTTNANGYLDDKSTWSGTTYLVNTVDPMVQTTLNTFNFDGAPAGTSYLQWQWDSDGSVQGTGPDLDGVTFEPSAVVPPGW
ncbi:hypothetical protein IT575_04600, partial [bacterium]|nr:hypothetical protein [bacterium]